MESIEKIESLTNIKMNFCYQKNSRIGDHICYYSNLKKINEDYPNWQLTKNIDDIFNDVFLNLKELI